MNSSNNIHYEQLRASGRVFSLLALLLGATAGILTGVVVKGVLGDPLVTGSNALLFYSAFGASTLIVMFVMLNYLMMSVEVSDGTVELKIGMKAASVPAKEISKLRVAETKSRMSRVASQASRGTTELWTVLGVGSGVEFERVRGNDNEKPQLWFIGSHNPEALFEVLNGLIEKNGPDTAADTDRGH